MKPHKIVPTKAQLKMMKEAWIRFKYIQEHFYGSVGRLERQLSKETGIKDLEFFMCDNEFVGIGQYDRQMALVQREELE